MPTPKDEVDALLKNCNQRKLSMIEKNKPLAEAITHFMHLTQSADTRVEGLSLNWFYENKLRPKYGGPSKIDTVKKFVREILLQDPTTGKSL